MTYSSRERSAGRSLFLTASILVVFGWAESALCESGDSQRLTRGQGGIATLVGHGGMGAVGRTAAARRTTVWSKPANATRGTPTAQLGQKTLSHKQTVRADLDQVRDALNLGRQTTREAGGAAAVPTFVLGERGLTAAGRSTCATETGQQCQPSRVTTERAPAGAACEILPQHTSMASSRDAVDRRLQSPYRHRSLLRRGSEVPVSRRHDGVRREVSARAP